MAKQVARKKRATRVSTRGKSRSGAKVRSAARMIPSSRLSSLKSRIKKDLEEA